MRGYFLRLWCRVLGCDYDGEELYGGIGHAQCRRCGEWGGGYGSALSLKQWLELRWWHFQQWVKYGGFYNPFRNRFYSRCSDCRKLDRLFRFPVGDHSRCSDIPF